MYIKPLIKKTKIDIGERYIIALLSFIGVFFSLLFIINIWKS